MLPHAAVVLFSFLKQFMAREDTHEQHQGDLKYVYTTRLFFSLKIMKKGMLGYNMCLGQLCIHPAKKSSRC